MPLVAGIVSGVVLCCCLGWCMEALAWQSGPLSTPFLPPLGVDPHHARRAEGPWDRAPRTSLNNAQPAPRNDRLPRARNDVGVIQQAIPPYGQEVPAPTARSAYFSDVHGRFTDVPAEFRCPISHDVMRDPVVAADGFTYERASIERWLTDHSTSPLPNLRMQHGVLCPNLTLRSLIIC
eukprot:UN3643